MTMRTRMVTAVLVGGVECSERSTPWCAWAHGDVPDPAPPPHQALCLKGAYSHVAWPCMVLARCDVSITAGGQTEE